jgi:predicted nucleotidyltransferase
VILDVMPSKPGILGFGNEWYTPAFETAMMVELPSAGPIRMVTAPYFLTTKLAAFDNRGKGDYFMSRDMEDLVTVLDGRPEIVDELARADQKLREHLTMKFAALLRDNNFVAALPGHLPGDRASQAQVPLIMERLEAMAGNK